MRIPSLRRSRSGPPVADEVIDLSEDSASEEADDLPGAGKAHDSAPSEDGTAAAQNEGPPADGGSDRLIDLTAAGAVGGEDAQDAGGTVTATGRAERRGRRFSILVSALTLRSGSGSAASPVVVVVLGWLWLTGWVVAGALAITLVSGFIAGGPLLRADTFIDSWRMLHLMPVASAAGPVSLVPMLPAMAVFALVVHASGWVWAHVQSRQPGWVPPAVGVGAMAGGYLVVAALIATVPTADAPDGPLAQGWLALVCLLLAGAGVTFARGLVQPAYPRTWLLFRAAGTVIALLLSLAFLALMLQLLTNWSQVWAMSTSLLSSGTQPATRFDAAALGAVQLAYLPNMVVWAAAYLVGAGFSVGQDTIVSPFSVTLGTLPELPITTLLPTQPLRWPWLPLVLVGAGSLLAGAVIRNAGLARQMRTRLVVGLAVALIAAVGMGFLAAASAGGLGPGRLDTMGPRVGLTMLATWAVVGLGQVAWALFPTLVADVGPFVEHGRHTVGGVRGRLGGRSGRGSRSGRGGRAGRIRGGSRRRRAAGSTPT